MLTLGFLQRATGLVSEDDLLKAIRENVPQRFLEVNLKAAKRGMKLAKDQNVSVEV